MTHPEITIGADPQEAHYRFGPYRFDPRSGLLASDDDETVLPNRAASVLETLISRRGRLVSKRELLSTVWKDAHVAESSLTDVVSCLRQALADDPRQPTYIQTIHRRGYRFIGELDDSAGDEDSPPSSASAADSTTPSQSRAVAVLRLLPWSVAVVSLVAAGLALSLERDAPSLDTPAPMRVSLDLQADQPVAWGWDRLAVSADGRTIAYVADVGDQPQLVLHRLEDHRGTTVAESDRAEAPFFSPDGRWLAFFQRGRQGTRLMKVAVDGGVPVPISSVSFPSGGSWGDDDTIVFGSRLGLMKVEAMGGRPQPLNASEPLATIEAHSPHLAAGSRVVVYQASGRHHSAIVASLLDGSRSATFGPSELGSERVGRPRLLPTGHLIYISGSPKAPEALMAVPFDDESLRLTGPPIPVTEPGMNLRNFDVSPHGTLVYQPGIAAVDEAQRQMVWVDRRGGVIPVRDLRGDFRTLRLSPDGSRIFAELFDGSHAELWVFGLVDDSREKLSNGFGHAPLWSPDGRELYFALAPTKRVAEAGGLDLYAQPADFSGERRLLLSRSGNLFPTSWTADGRVVLHEMQSAHQRQILLFDPDGKREAEPLLRPGVRFNERSAMVSPDGRWLVYVSDESGQDEVYIRGLRGDAGRKAISNDGGVEPLWAPSGKEVFYRQADRMIAVGLDLADVPRVRSRAVLFKGPYYYMGIRTVYDYDPRTARFLMARTPVEGTGRVRLNLVLNWFEGLRAVVAAGS